MAKLEMKIVGLNPDTAFVLIREDGSKWLQRKFKLSELLTFVALHFPEVIKQARPYQFTDIYQVANWLYNYGEGESSDTYIFQQ